MSSIIVWSIVNIVAIFQLLQFCECTPSENPVIVGKFIVTGIVNGDEVNIDPADGDATYNNKDLGLYMQATSSQDPTHEKLVVWLSRPAEIPLASSEHVHTLECSKSNEPCTITNESRISKATWDDKKKVLRVVSKKSVSPQFGFTFEKPIIRSRKTTVRFNAPGERGFPSTTRNTLLNPKAPPATLSDRHTDKLKRDLILAISIYCNSV